MRQGNQKTEEQEPTPDGGEGVQREIEQDKSASLVQPSEQLQQQDQFNDQIQQNAEIIRSEQDIVQEENDHFQNQEQIEQEIIDPKYGDKKIDLSDIQQNLLDLQNNSRIILEQEGDPSRPAILQQTQKTPNEPLPSYSDRVNIQQFSVGHYKEFQLREDLANLIDKYNKQFGGATKKPVINKANETEKANRYQNKVIVNPIAVPDPKSSEGNYSWMYLMTPYYNQLVKEFSQSQMENQVLQQHYEYYLEMVKEQELLNEEFRQLKKSESSLQNRIEGIQTENQVLEDQVMHLEKNLNQILPDRFKEMNDKLENLNNVLKSKDSVIDQLLNEITLVKNEKDDLQNEVLFKKQRIENLNIEFNTKELEYQRLWEEEQALKSELRGDTTDARAIKRENEALLREIALFRDEINQNKAVYDQISGNIQNQRARVSDYESRLLYANDVIQQLEAENQQIQIDNASCKSAIEAQGRAYNELKNNFYMMSNYGQDGSLQIGSRAPIISIPKMVMPSSYYKPTSTVQKATINLMPSTTKALSQQVAPNNIKSYLSVKKAVIDLTSDFPTAASANQMSRDQRVRFSIDAQTSGGLSNLPASNNRNTMNPQRRSDSLDARIDRRNFKTLTNELEPQDSFSMKKKENTNTVRTSIRVGGSINRNHIDSMSGIFGMTDDKQNLINMRASVQGNSFPLKKPQSPGSSPQRVTIREPSYLDSPTKDFRTVDTDVSTEYYNGLRMTDTESLNGLRMSSTMSTQTPFKNKITIRGAAGNRSSQPQQLSSVKQRQYQQYSNIHQQPQKEEQKYREATWEARMSQLPKNSAYKSSITFAEDGITIKNENNNQRGFYEATSNQPFQMAKDYGYDVDVDAMNEDDPQAKTQVIKFKQQKLFELADQRKLVIQIQIYCYIALILGKSHPRIFEICG